MNAKQLRNGRIERVELGNLVLHLNYHQDKYHITCYKNGEVYFHREYNLYRNAKINFKRLVNTL